MYRDFTYIDDLVKSIVNLSAKIPNTKDKFEQDSLSPIAPFRIVNIGNSNQVKLIEFVKLIENELNLKAQINFLPIQQGDVYNLCKFGSFI